MLYWIVSGSCSQIGILSSMSLLKRFLSAKLSIFILIPGMQFQLISWTRCCWTSSLLLKFNMSIYIQDQKKNCFEGHFLVAAYKHDKNCAVIFIPSNSPYQIRSRSNIARKSIFGEISFLTCKPECRNW